MLINQKHVKAFALEMAKSRAHKFTESAVTSCSSARRT